MKTCSYCNKPEKETLEMTHWRVDRTFSIGGSPTDYCDCEVTTAPVYRELGHDVFPTNNTANNIPQNNLPPIIQQNTPPTQPQRKKQDKILFWKTFGVFLIAFCVIVILWKSVDESKAKKSPN